MKPDLLQIRQKFYTLTHSQSVFTLVMIVAVLLFAILALRNVSYHRLFSSSDHSSITYSLVFKDPARFNHDWRVTIWREGYLWSTLPNWSSALLWRYVGLSPYFFAGLLTFLNGVTMGAGAGYLVYVVTHRRSIALLGVFFIYAVSVWGWSLANYPRVFPFFYEADWALGVTMILFALVLEDRQRLLLPTLFIVGLIHPSTCVYTGAALCLYYVWIAIEKRNIRLLSLVLATIGVVGLSLLPSQLVNMQAHGTIPHDIVRYKMFNQNAHFVPFPLKLSEPRIATFGEWVLLGIISMRYWKELNPRFWKLVVSIGCAALVFSLTHWIGVKLEIIPFIQLIGTRSTTLVSVILMPAIICYWWQHLTSGTLVGVLLALWCLLMVILTDYGLYRWLIFALFLLDLSQGYMLLWRIHPPLIIRHILGAVAALLATVWSYGFIRPSPVKIGSILGIHLWEKIPRLADNRLLPEYVQPIYVGRHDYSLTVLLFVLVMLAIVLVWRFYHFEKTLIWVTFLVIYAGGASYNLYYHTELYTASPQRLALYNAQLWAREHTPADALFIGVEDSWRAGSQRPYTYFYPWGWYVYFLDERLLEHEEHLLDWYNMTREQELLYSDYQVFYNSPAQEFLYMRDYEYGDYLLIQRGASQWGNLPFERVYYNTYFFIYDLHKPQSSLITDLDERVQAQWSGRLVDTAGYILDLAPKGGLNSLRPNLVLGYVPTGGRTIAFSIPNNPYVSNESLWLSKLWQSTGTLSPASYLAMYGIKYLYIDEDWWNNQTPAQRAVLDDPAQFEEVFFITEGTQIRALYRVTASPSDHDDILAPLQDDQATLVKMVNADWAKIVPEGQQTFLPGDNLQTGIALQLDLLQPADLDNKDALAAWSNTKLPSYLVEMEIDYLLVDTPWIGWLSEAEVATLNDTNYYHMVKEWSIGSNSYRLYKVMGTDK